MRPRTQSLARVVHDGRVAVLRPDGSALVLGDPDGTVSVLLALADGTLDVPALVERAATALPGVSPSRIERVVGELFGRGVLAGDDIAFSPTEVDLEFYGASLSFFALFALFATPDDSDRRPEEPGGDE